MLLLCVHEEEYMQKWRKKVIIQKQDPNYLVNFQFALWKCAIYWFIVAYFASYVLKM